MAPCCQAFVTPPTTPQRAFCCWTTRPSGASIHRPAEQEEEEEEEEEEPEGKQ